MVRITKKRVELPTGDYALEGHENCCLVERKAGLSEVFDNVLTFDRDRFLRAISRLSSSCKYPVLVWEGSPQKLLSSKLPDSIDPGVPYSGMLRVLMEHRVSLISLPSETVAHRTATGETIARMLIEGALSSSKQTTNEDKDSATTVLGAPHKESSGLKVGAP